MKAVFRRLIARVLERQVTRLIARHKLKVVAVIGSVGKTSTKLAVAEVLRAKYRVQVRPGNYNSEIGLPLSIFGLSAPGFLLNPLAWLAIFWRTSQQLRRYPYDLIVVELGTDRPGDMAVYARYLVPDLAIVTAVTPEHMENFPGGLDEVAAEELGHIAGAKAVLVSADDVQHKYLKRYLGDHSLLQTYGLSNSASFRANIVTTTPMAGSHVEFQSDGAKLDVRLSLLGEPAVKSALAAWAAGRQFGVSEPALAKALEGLEPVAGRLNPLPGLNGSIILDDTYNAQPDAVVAALATLASLPGQRRLAILGSMNELGATSQVFHEQVGEAAAGLDQLITIGADAKRWLAPAAIKAGLDPSRCHTADSPYAAAGFLKPQLKTGDLVLIKGSQNRVFAEEAVKMLLADPADAHKLVRQSQAWLRVKRRQFTDAPRVK